MLGILTLSACAASPALPWESQPLLVGEEGRCDACGATTNAERGGARWPDERLACSSCLRQAVVAPDQAQAVYREAEGEVRDLLGLRVDQARLRIVLTDKAHLLSLAGELSHPDLRAFTEVLETIRGETVESRRFMIYLLRGLPRPCLLGIICHELCHVWQVLQGGTRPAADPPFREGAAQYVQHRVLSTRSEEAWARRLLENPDPIYGQGLRRFRELAARRGEGPALELSANANGFPPGF